MSETIREQILAILDTGLTVSMPEDGFTETVLDNLRKLVDAKASLITKAMGTDRLGITVADGKVSFP